MPPLHVPRMQGSRTVAVPCRLTSDLYALFEASGNSVLGALGETRSCFGLSPDSDAVETLSVRLAMEPAFAIFARGVTIPAR